MHKTLFAAVLACTTLASAVTAEMAPRWQDERVVSNSLSNAACNGSDAAYRALVDRARLDQMQPDGAAATARVSLAWLTTQEKCGIYFTGDEKQATSYYLDAALAGYPLALGAMAIRLVTGRGVDKDPEMGLRYARRAAAGGYAHVAIEVAERFILGNGLERNAEKAREWLTLAEQAGADQTALDETRAMLEGEFGQETPAEVPQAQGNRWLPPLSGNGFHQVGNKCVMRNGVMTVATAAGIGSGPDAPALIGISSDDWNYSGQVGQEHDARLTIQVNLFDGGPRFSGTPRAGNANTLVIPVGADKTQSLWERWENKCMWNRDASEMVTYKLGDGGQVFFDASEFFQPEVWSQFKSCAGIVFLSSSDPCQ